MAERAVVARSPVAAAGPVAVVSGWEVSVRRSAAPLTVSDWTPVAKVLVRAAPGGQVARALGAPFGTARRDEHGTLVVGSRPGEWLLLAAPGRGPALVRRWQGVPDEDLVTIVDVTSGRALMRLTGDRAPALLAKVCALDFEAAPTGSAFRTPVAGVVNEVVKDDERSYLLACDRSFGRYLFDALFDAGREFSIDVTGFSLPGGV